MDSQHEDETPKADENPLLFWVAYIPREDGGCNYLGNGKGGIKVFKTESAIRKYVESSVPPEVYETVVFHSTQGMIAIPEEDFERGVASVPQEFAHSLKPQGQGIISILNTPIRTLAAPTFPTASELLEEHIRRRGARPRKK